MSGFTNIENSVAIVTGGASGIGRGIVEELAAAGARVVIADIQQDAVDKAAAEIGAFGVVTDVSSLDGVRALAATVIDQFGRVDIVCNNAGVGSVAKIEAMTIDDWKWMIDVNLWGVIHGVNTFLPLLAANPNGGHFLNTASMGGLAIMPSLGSYAVTKFGVVALSEALAIELAEDHPAVGVSILCPGPVRSNIGKSRRNRPSTLDEGGLIDIELDDVAENFGGTVPWLDARDAGRIAVDAIRRGDLYAFTHPHMAPVVEQRHDAISAAMAAARE